MKGWRDIKSIVWGIIQALIATMTLPWWACLFISHSFEARGIQTSTCGSLAPLWWSHLRVYRCLAVFGMDLGPRRSEKVRKMKEVNDAWLVIGERWWGWWFSGSLFVGLPAWCPWCMQTRVSSSPALGPWALAETLAQVFFFRTETVVESGRNTNLVQDLLAGAIVQGSCFFCSFSTGNSDKISHATCKSQNSLSAETRYQVEKWRHHVEETNQLQPALYCLFCCGSAGQKIAWPICLANECRPAAMVHDRARWGKSASSLSTTRS